MKIEGEKMYKQRIKNEQCDFGIFADWDLECYCDWWNWFFEDC
jgi:hypothetical protein